MVADLLRSRWQRFCPPPSSHSIPLIQYGACFGTYIQGDTWPLHVARQHLSLALVLTQELSFSIWHLPIAVFLLIAPYAVIHLCQLQHHPHVVGGTSGAETIYSIPVAAVAEYTMHCPATVVQCILVGSCCWGLWCFEETECNHSVHHQACTRALSSLLKLQQNRPCSRPAGASLRDKGGSHLYCTCWERVETNTEYPVFLAWVFLPMGTSLSAPVKSCYWLCGNWETRGPVQSRRPSLVVWAYPKRLKITL